MSTQTSLVQAPEALRHKAFDALYRGDVETAQAILVVEGVLEAPAAVLLWTQRWQGELVELRRKNRELDYENTRLGWRVSELEDELNPPKEPEEAHCPACGDLLMGGEHYCSRCGYSLD